jgi:hypothetical protein
MMAIPGGNDTYFILQIFCRQGWRAGRGIIARKLWGPQILGIILNYQQIPDLVMFVFMARMARLVAIG